MPAYAIRDGEEEARIAVAAFTRTEGAGLNLSAFRMLEIRNGGWVPLP